MYGVVKLRLWEKKMKVLLVGGSGMVGTFITPYLSKHHELRVLDLNPPEHDVDYVSGSMTNADDVRRALDGMDTFIDVAMLSPQGGGSTVQDEKVIAELTQVKGIGRWTAQMFLMFCLGRPDVLPHDDLGIRSALRNLYGLNDLPDKTTCKAIAQPWRPYTTVTCWYCWRSLELPKIS